MDPSTAWLRRAAAVTPTDRAGEVNEEEADARFVAATEGGVLKELRKSCISSGVLGRGTAGDAAAAAVSLDDDAAAGKSKTKGALVLMANGGRGKTAEQAHNKQERSYRMG